MYISRPLSRLVHLQNRYSVIHYYDIVFLSFHDRGLKGWLADMILLQKL
jgi:hypothetical protein